MLIILFLLFFTIAFYYRLCFIDYVLDYVDLKTLFEYNLKNFSIIYLSNKGFVEKKVLLIIKIVDYLFVCFTYL